MRHPAAFRRTAARCRCYKKIFEKRRIAPTIVHENRADSPEISLAGELVAAAKWTLFVRERTCTLNQAVAGIRDI
jgi:hypothetical protein